MYAENDLPSAKNDDGDDDDDDVEEEKERRAAEASRLATFAAGTALNCMITFFFNDDALLICDVMLLRYT